MKTRVSFLGILIVVIYSGINAQVYSPNGLIQSCVSTGVGLNFSNPNNMLSIWNSALQYDAKSGHVDFSLFTHPDGYGPKLSAFKEDYNQAGLAFFTQLGWGEPRESMRITSSGNIGINTPFSPTNSVLTIRNPNLAYNATSGSVDLLFSTSTNDGVGTKISTFKDGENTAGIAFYTQFGYTAPSCVVERMRISADGNICIGTPYKGDVKLDVGGAIRATEVKVCLSQGCDFVFSKDYKLRTITEVEKFIQQNNHLPEILPAKEMESNGINLSEMNAKLLQKIEEQTLYIIELNKRLTELENKMKK